MDQKTGKQNGGQNKSLELGIFFLLIGLVDFVVMIMTTCSKDVTPIFLVLLLGIPMILAVYLKYSSGQNPMETFSICLAFQLILLLSLYWVTLNMLMFDCPSSDRPVVKEWSELQPLTPFIEYYGTQWGNDSGRFTIKITSTLGTTIKVTGAQIKEGLTGAICETTINGRPAASLAGSGETVHPGKDFKLDAFCMPAGKEGDPYRMVITVNYSRTQGGIISLFNHTGIVEGTIS
jgi:hypothetical protein